MIHFVLPAAILQFWDSIQNWRIISLVLVVLVIILLAVQASRANSLFTRKRLRDLRVFGESRARMSEQDVIALIDSLDKGICHLSQWTNLREYLDFVANKDNQYSDSNLRKSVASLARELEDVRQFILEHFSMNGHGQPEGCLEMHPQPAVSETQGNHDLHGYLLDRKDLYVILRRLHERDAAYCQAVSSRLKVDCQITKENSHLRDDTEGVRAPSDFPRFTGAMARATGKDTAG